MLWVLPRVSQMTRKWLSQTPNPKIIEVLNQFSVSSSAKQPSLNIEAFLSYLRQDPWVDQKHSVQIPLVTPYQFVLSNSGTSARFLKGWPNQSRERLTTYNHTTSALKGIRMADFPSASDFIDNNNVLKSNISAYRNGQFTTLYFKQYEMKEKLRSIRK